MSERQKVLTALLASALLHLVGLVVLGLLWSMNQRDVQASVPAPEKPLVVTLITAPPPEKKIEKPVEKPVEKKLVEKPKPKARAKPAPKVAKAKPTPEVLRPLLDSEGLAES